MDASKRARVTIAPLPAWLDAGRLCGAEPTRVVPCGHGRVAVELSVPLAHAAELTAQLRGLGFAGAPLSVKVEPSLRRDEVRAGRLAEARARRDTSVGFHDPRARAEGEGRYSLTPELLALALGGAAQGLSVVDACAGSGGNALGFARSGARVTAIERDGPRRDELAHNARIYGVEDRLRILAGDARVLVPTLAADVLFIDPPWGELYDKRCVRLADLPLLAALLSCDLRAYGALWLKVPPSFDTDALPAFGVEAWFGHAAGDRRRVKFLLLRGTPDRARSAPDRTF